MALSFFQCRSWVHIHSRSEVSGYPPPTTETPAPIPAFYQVHTPLNVIAWKQMLTDHPDQRLVSYLVNGIKDGFRIGFDHTRCSAQLCLSGKNMGSAKKNPDVVQAYIDSEVDVGRLVPVQDEHPNIHISSFGVIPKRSQPGKWRLVVALSSLNGRSVNDGISARLNTLQCTMEQE